MAETNKLKSTLKRLIMFSIPIAIGVLLFMFMSQNRKAPKQKEIVQDIPNVRVMEIQPIDLTPRAIGYGSAEPVRVFKAIAQVSGKITYTNPLLEKGRVLKKGEELVRIDPTEYEIDISKLKANIQNYEVQIQQTRIEEKNNLKLLELQKTDLEIKRKEVDRQKELYNKQIISKTEYEAQLQGFVSQEVQVQNIQNSLNLVPIQIELLQTQMKQAKNDLETAQLRLSYTSIKAPFDLQVSVVNNKLSEYVQTGQTILEASDISETEVEAQFVMKAMLPIFLSIREQFEKVVPETVKLGEVLGVKAKVRIAGDQLSETVWPAVFSRRSDTLDVETRTIGFIVTVKNDLKGEVRKGRARILLKGAYCEVELIGKEQKGIIAIPRSALFQENTVYLMDNEQKLRKKKVEILYEIDDIAVIKKGLQQGDTLILSDIIPAVEGIKVSPVEDKEAFTKLKNAAKGGRS